MYFNQPILLDLIEQLVKQFISTKNANIFKLLVRLSIKNETIKHLITQNIGSPTTQLYLKLINGIKDLYTVDLSSM